jgi:Superinfection immunity protein
MHIITLLLATAELTPAEEAATPVVGLLLLAALLGFALMSIFTWLLPGIIANKRSHPDASSIWLTTIFLGWTFFGWLAALIWAASAINGSRPQRSALPPPLPQHFARK